MSLSNKELVLSVDVLKQHSGEFDLESVTTLVFDDFIIRGIDQIGPHCPNLRSLQIHNGGLTSIRDIASCSNLRRLRLARNRLQSLDGIRFLENLEELYVQDNDIADIGKLESELYRLPRLHTLFLRNLSGTLPNPLCSMEGYKSEVRLALPRIRILDGERGHCTMAEEGDGMNKTPSAAIVSKSNLYTLSDNLDGLLCMRDEEANRQATKLFSDAWVSDGFWDLGDANDDDTYKEKVEELQRTLLECKNLNDTATNMCSQMMRKITG